MTVPADTTQDNGETWHVYIKHGKGGWLGPKVGTVKGARHHDEALYMFCKEAYLSQDDVVKFVIGSA